MQKFFRPFALLAFVLVTALTAAPMAHAAVDRVVVDGITGGFSGVNGQLLTSIHVMDGSTEIFPNSIPFLIGTATTSSQVLEASNAAITSWATGAGYTLTNGIIYPYASVDQVNALIASSTVRAMSFTNPTRSLNTAFQVSSTSAAFVSYTVDVATALSLTGGQTGTVTLQYADDSGFTTNVKTVQSSVNGNTGTLTIGLAITQISTAAVTGMVPVGKYVKIVTANTTGTPTFTFRAAQEVLLPSN